VSVRRAPILGTVAAALAVGLVLVGGSALLHRHVPAAGRVTVTGSTPVLAEDTGSPSPSVSATPSASPSTSPSAAPTPARTTPKPPAAPAPVSNLATRFRTIPAGTRQLIVVYSDGFAATYATVETFDKVNGVWQPALGKLSARIGTKGFSDHKVEGDLATPTGVYGIGPTMYGIAGNPGVRYPYHQLVEGDYWNEDGGSPGYNTFVHGADPGNGSEALWQVTPQYTYLAVINYNVPAVPADPPRGSAIFLHVEHPGHATAGCVALADSDLVRVLTWLNPGAAPRIVLAPSQVLNRY